MYNKLTPNLMVSNVKETVTFYKDILGFEIDSLVPETQDCVLKEIPQDRELVYALLKNNQVELMFQYETNLKSDVTALADFNIGASATFYFEISGIKKFYNSIKDKAIIVKDLKRTWYGMDEFYIKDNNGYILGFSEKSEA